MNEKISIIVPIFNAEKTLSFCIDSIINQTYKNLQLIFVNDGSIDNSFEIVTQYANNDERIEIVNKPNGGQVSARKAGIEKAKGKYTLFLDSDDWIEEDYVECLYNEMVKSDADIVCSDIYYDSEDGQTSKVVSNIFGEGVYSIEDINSRVLFSGEFWTPGIQPHLVTKLFQTKKLKEYVYAVDNQIIFGEDAVVTYPYLFSSNTICISKVCGYHYIQYQNSMAKKVFSDDNKRISFLISHLKKYLPKNSSVAKQIDIYEKFLWILRCPSAFDEGSTTKLHMYGGVPAGSKIVIYGAGGAGAVLYDYVNSLNVYHISAWIDRNASFYRSRGLNVVTLDLLPDDFDYILIANTSQKIADVIRKNLMDKGVEQEKIHWYIF